MALGFLGLNPRTKKINLDTVILFLTLGGVAIGIAGGLGLRWIALSEHLIILINFPGELFMQVLKMMVLPLIFTSMISSLARMDAKESGQMGIVALGYYILTAILSSILAIFLVVVIHPGDPSIKHSDDIVNPSDTEASSFDTVLDLFRNMLPGNIFQATFERLETSYIPVNGTSSRNLQYVEGTNVLGVIVFCTAFGISLSRLGLRARPVIDFFVVLDAAIMQLFDAIMWVAPIGIASLVAGNLLKVNNIVGVLGTLSLYVGTVIIGLIIHTVVTVPLLYVLVTKRNPLFICKGMAQSFFTTLGTASSGASIPISIQCMEQKCDGDPRVARFIFPLGSTINMDGTALYETVAIVFIAQLNNYEMSMAELFTACITTNLSSIGMGSVPAGLVSVLLILNTLGLPMNDVSLLLTVDWLLDRVRTAINVLDDGFACAIVSGILERRWPTVRSRLGSLGEIETVPKRSDHFV